MMRREILRGTYEGAWVLVVLAFVFGWAFAFTTVGAVSIYAGMAGSLALLLIGRSPGALVAFTLVMSLGWLPLLLASPWLLIVPAAVVYVAWRWHQRRTTATV